jgi:hypothetical protein
VLIIKIFFLTSKEMSCGKTPCTCSKKKTEANLGVPKTNKWQVFLKEFREKNKQLYKGKSGVEVVKLAAAEYRRIKYEGNSE